MPVPFWQPGNLYQPGDIVQPNLTSAVSSVPPTNPGFESGDVDWTKGVGWTIENTAGFEGAFRGNFTPGGGPAVLAVKVNGDRLSQVSVDGGVNWTEAGAPFLGGTSITLSEIAFSPTLNSFLMYRSGRVSRTTDGQTWTDENTLGTSGAPRVMGRVDAYNLWVYGGTGGASGIFTSVDGVNWTLRDASATGDFADSFAYSPSLGRVVMFSSGGRLHHSIDGITWTSVLHGVSGPTGVVWANSLNLFVGVSSTGGNSTITSADGITWANTGNSLSFGAGDIAYSPTLGRVVTARVSDPGAGFMNFAYSDDGVTWTEVADERGSWTQIEWDTNFERFVALDRDGGNTGEPFGDGTGAILTSPDGITWTRRDLPEGGTLNHLVAGGSSANIVPMTSDDRVPVTQGVTAITARGYMQSTGLGGGRIGVAWYDSGNVLLSTDYAANSITGVSAVYRQSSVTATAPPNAATAGIVFGGDGFTDPVFVDNAAWDYAYLAPASEVIFRAVQPAAGYSDGVEPAWPATVGLQVIDNEVTWEAIAANRIVWQATAILKSGPTEPVFSTEPDGSTLDNSIVWRAVTRRIEDVNCPNTKEVAILASKVFAGDDDIVAFSATVNPLDWTTIDDAGFIPFGLNTYGSQPVSALGIYRSNLVVFNNKAFQMWQVDEDPANFAILDAVPIGCPFHRSLSPVSNDLVFLTSEGIRSMGIAGASTNLQAGFFGKQIDPLVLEAVKGGEIPNALFFPGAGQYWLFFGEEAFVLTINGGKADMSWSRYVFPAVIDDWTLQNQDLFLRAGDKIWKVDDDILVDDFGDTNAEIIGQVWWPYLDFGALGVTKQLIGFDTVAAGEYSVSIGYNQNNVLEFTPPYTVMGDTIPGDIIPIPVAAPSLQLRLQFENNQAVPWEWSASTLYVQDFRRTS